MSAYRALFTTTALTAGLMLATPVFAADQPDQTPPPADNGASNNPPATPPPPKKPKQETAESENTSSELVVTGSLIKSKTFTSPAPMLVITSQQAELEGQVDTAQLLQMSPVAANSSQINNFLTGFVGFAGGAGANTLSLRGLGAQRTLILLNGERMGPAGISGEVGPIDLNTIPESIIDHIEILKDGASSIYGSDAVAGVVNIITKQNQDGGNLHAFVNPSEHGGGNTFQVEGSYGKTFAKGYINAGFEWYRQDRVTVGERGFLNCARDLVTDPATGQSADMIDPLTGSDKCFNAILGVEDLVLFDPTSGATLANDYRANPSAQAGGVPAPGESNLFGFGLDLDGFQAEGLQLCGGNMQTGTGTHVCLINPATGTLVGPINTVATRAEMAAVPYNDPKFDQQDAVSPVSRYTFTLFAGYDLTPHAQLYGSVLLNQRDSSQTGFSQFFTVVDAGNPFNQALGPNAFEQAVFGPFNPVFSFPGHLVPANGFVEPLPIVPQITTSSQRVDYGRFVLGVKGDLPSWGNFTNWTYDLYGQYAIDDASYSEEYQKTDRVNATAGASIGTNGCDVNANIEGGLTMAQAEPGVACVPVNFFAAVANGGFTPAEFAFLYSTADGHTRYDHAYVDGSMTGDVFNLPAGPVGAAVGFQVRRESINDTPPPDFANGNAYNISSGGITKGSETVEEAYAELKVPVLKDFIAVKSFDVDVSGRYSHYSTFGGNFTYKITADWKTTDWLAFRGTYGTAFRAPALYELFLSPFTGFLQQFQLGDPCINYGTSGVSPTIQANCARQGITPTYNGTGSPSASIFNGGGLANNLKAETSIAQTVGFVLTPHWRDQTFNIAVTYYNFDIQNQITQFGSSNILFSCYNSTAAINPVTNLPNSPFCSLFTRNGSTASGQFAPFGIETVENNFINVAKETDQGLDLDFNYTTPLPKDSKLTVDSELSWTFYTQTLLLDGVVNNFLGSIGNPRFVGFANAKFDHGPWTLNYLIQFIGPTSDNPFSSTSLGNFRGTGATVNADYSVPFYSISSISLRRHFDKFTLEAGVKNLFDEKPGNISASDNINFREGTIAQTISQYDLIGRSFFVDVDAKF